MTGNIRKIVTYEEEVLVEGFRAVSRPWRLFADAPRNDEIVVALGGATGGRPHHRIGDRYQDLGELGHDVDNPASVRTEP